MAACKWMASAGLVLACALCGGLATAQDGNRDSVAAAGNSAAATVPEFSPKRAAAQGTSGRALDADVQDLKKQVLDLNKDLFLLEEELLFPSNTQVAVFVSMDVGEFFGLDSVELKLDNKDVTNYLYTERETSALIKGGVQRLYVGNLKAGQHELVAVFTGEGPHTRDYRRGASLKFEKGIGPKYIELTISDRESKQQPEFVVKEWE
ncbi:MAG TPA: AraC family transcriptional regulator [Gammaproteobacteria bacterium]|nr:AraC family transcriptional regulator [Gammaproteobacteria bacterium]